MVFVISLSLLSDYTSECTLNEFWSAFGYGVDFSVCLFTVELCTYFQHFEHQQKHFNLCREMIFLHHIKTKGCDELLTIEHMELQPLVR